MICVNYVGKLRFVIYAVDRSMLIIRLGFAIVHCVFSCGATDLKGFLAVSFDLPIMSIPEFAHLEDLV